MTSNQVDLFPYLKSKRVLLTGGTGFVGRHLLPLLLEAGAEVSCLVRASSDTSRLPGDVETVQADLITGRGLDAALASKDLVIHLAALLFGFSWQDYLRANAMAARCLAGAVTRLRETGRMNRGCRFVLVSSLASTGPCATEPGVADNASPMPVSAYGWSKLLTESILSNALGEHLITLRPPIIYGSGDRGLLPMFRGIKHGLAFSPGWRRVYPVSAIHADDMARAVLCACLPTAYGIYHLNDGQSHTMDEFYHAMAGAVDCVLGRKTRRMNVIHMPLPFLNFTAAFSTTSCFVADALCRHLTGHGLRKAPQWNLDKCREARQPGWLCDGSRIRHELGFSPQINLEAGMLEAARGYVSEGLL